MTTVFQNKRSAGMKYAILLTLSIFLSLSLKASTIYVNSSATGSNNGTSWANAYTSFQSALNGAVSGDQIWVSKGTYKPSYDYGMGGGSRYYHFEMIEGVAIYGGFAGTESSVSQRANYQLGEVNETVLSGDLAGNDIWDCSFYDPWVGAIKGTTGTDNCYHVIYNPVLRGLTSNAVIDGFTITGGNANYYQNTSPHIKGGGMYNSQASPTIRNCTFTKNQAYIAIEGSGEAMALGSCIFNDISNPSISNCLFTNNFDHTSTIWCQNGGITMSNCTITHNYSWIDDSGVYILQNMITSSITNCTFSYNNGPGYGTALTTDYANNLTISGCSFIGNTARYYYNDSYGVGVVCNLNSTNINITNCNFSSNDINNLSGTVGEGGAIYNGGVDCENINISNCVFSNNKASHGGAIAISSATCTVTNSSFSNNIATVAGGAAICYKREFLDDYSGYIVFDNCAFWNNTSPIGNEFYSDGHDASHNCKIEINYSCFPNGTGDLVTANGGEIVATNHNIHSNPLFFNRSNNDLRLTTNSPCINAGNNAYNTASTDIRGQARIQNVTIDMGAYEWTEGVDPRLAIYVKYNATGNNDGTSWADAYTSFQSALNTAIANDDIYIARGTYKPSSAYTLTNTPRYYHFELKNNVGIYGGFAGTETSVSQRTGFGYGGANETILSGDIGTPGVNTDNCLHVFYNPSTGITNTALLDGVTITGGNANNASINEEKRGGAIYMSGNSPTFSNVVVTGNYAIFGGGACNNNSSAKYNNCLFFNNNADYGGAVMNFGSNLVAFNNCTFYGNTATTHGGGVDHSSSSPSYNNCIFWGNTSATGNQIYGYLSSTITLNYSCFSNSSNDIATETSASSVQTTNNDITSNPLFVNPAGNDFRLYGNSPSVNTGNNGYNALSTDIRGQARIQNTTIDMGAYEWTSGLDPASLITWTGALTTNWNTAGNWSPASVPIATDDVLIPDVTNDPTVNEAPTSPAVCRNLTVQSGSTLTIAAGKALTVNGDLTNNNSNDGLILESDDHGTGSLIHNSSNVAATVESYITGSAIYTSMKYHFVSIPTHYASPTSNLFFGSYLYKLDATQLEGADYGKWVDLGSSTTTGLSNASGYMIYYPESSHTYTFEGSLNNGDFPTTVIGHTGAYTYNLIPNPYPSAINWGEASGWTKSAGIGGSIYIFRASTGNYTTLTGTANIPSGQAFIVLDYNEASPSVTIKNAARVHSSQAFYKSAELKENRLVISASSNNYYDETVVAFDPEATEGFDLPTDGMKLAGIAEAPQLSTLAGGHNLSINTLPPFQNEVIVPMEFETEYSGPVTFNASDMNSFDNLVSIYLEDRELGNIINLRQDPLYTFNYQAGSAKDRFKLRFNGTIGINETSATVEGRAFISNGRLYLDIPSMQGQLTQINVYNTLGQVIRSEDQMITSIINLEASFSKGVYIVHASSADKHFVIKVINK